MTCQYFIIIYISIIYYILTLLYRIALMNQIQSIYNHPVFQLDYYPRMNSPQNQAIMHNPIFFQTHKKKLEALKEAGSNTHSNTRQPNTQEKEREQAMMIPYTTLCYPESLHKNGQHMKSSSHLENYCIQSPVQKVNRKPRIIFSYNKQEKKDPDFQKFYASKKDDKKQRSVTGGEIKQFQLTLDSKSKKLKNKLDRNVLEFVNNPARGIMSNYISMTNDHDQPFELRSTKSQRKKVANNSEMASTEATTSYLNEANYDFNVHHKQKNNKKFQFRHKGRGKPNLNYKKSLTDKLSPSKLLKKTIMLSKHYFGDVFKNNSIQNTNSIIINDLQQESHPQKWIDFAKCLFQDDLNLKESIHCGPELKILNKNDVLVGFGRQIDSSHINNDDQ